MAQKLDLTRYSPTFPEFVANGETLPSNGDRKLTVSPDEYSIASSLYSTRPDRTTDSKAIADRVSSGNNKSMIDGISTQFSKNELENSPLAKTAFGTFTIDSRPFLDPNSSSMLIDEEVPWDEERWKRTIDEEEPWEAEEEDSQPLDFSIKKKPKIYFHADATKQNAATENGRVVSGRGKFSRGSPPFSEPKSKHTHDQTSLLGLLQTATEFQRMAKFSTHPKLDDIDSSNMQTETEDDRKDANDPTKPGKQKPIGNGRKRPEPVPVEEKNTEYRLRRQKNNVAAKKSRDIKRKRGQEIDMKVAALEFENKRLMEQMMGVQLQIAMLKILHKRHGIEDRAASVE